MPGARSRVKPVPASESSASDEASQLDLHLQRQLEEDVARIFDESIYSDLEVVCGKLKILTHSCILRARTNQFYHKLKTILHVDIERNTFDEIYSFISDAYTECNIKHQEKEIITYLNDKLNLVKSVSNNVWIANKDSDEPDVFVTPTCSISPYTDKGFQKSINSSPSTELTKEYYALVPIEINLLEKELKEQDVLSNAFQSIIKSQTEDLNKVKVSPRSKPTSLSLSSSHISKTIKHSDSYDILSKCHLKDNISTQTGKNNEKKVNLFDSQIVESNKNTDGSSCELATDKVIECAYSPDSLITDDPSSSSDYLSAAYTFSPGISSSGCHPQLNVGDNITKMENIFTSSDSGLENTGLLESLSSHKDVTLTDVSLTESTLHDLTTDDTNESFSSSLADKNHLQRIKLPSTQTASASTSIDKDFNGQMPSQPIQLKDPAGIKSSKDEKQRQNEEIVILESSSLSSETGSWESVFPLKLSEKELCDKFLVNERKFAVGVAIKNNDKFTENLCPSLVQKSPFKSTSCFIDAASLMDEEDDTIKIQTDMTDPTENAKSDKLPTPSQPVPCSTAKLDISPSDWSESNDNEDSLEQPDNSHPDSIQKDMSPTIFDMTPITEDSLCTNAFESARQEEKDSKTSVEIEEPCMYVTDKDSSFSSSTVFVSNTPHNSILSLKTSSLKQYESEGSESDTTIVGSKNLNSLKKYNESSPIISGGASIEDHLPHIGSHVGSPSIRRKIENIPIVSGAYIADVEVANPKKSAKASSASAWVVDMSRISKSDCETSNSSAGVRRPTDRACDNLKNESKHSSLDNCNKSRSSVDSDSSEKSSHKFYIDLSSLPDPIPAKKNNDNDLAEKKNIFSMYIDLGETSTLKEMPARLSSSLNTNTKKISTSEAKIVPKAKTGKGSSNESPAVIFPKTAESCTIFEKYESLCNDPNISISEIIRIPEQRTPNISDTKVDSDKDTPKLENQSRGILADRFSHRNPITVIEEDTGKEQSVDLFVKLSDLDKPAQKAETLVINEERVLDVRMTRSIPDNNWGDQSTTGASRSIEVISSFHSENALSLNRLFPHLKNEFSRSMPGSLSGRTRSPLRLGVSSSPGDIDEHSSDMSEISSVQSSICRSVVENSTTEETSQTSSLIGNCQSRLGQDLLRMFLEEIAPDVIVEVSGRRIKAHKCILSSRCQYFAGILSGGWVESAGNVIVLPPFSFNVVHFALCHIYSGVSTIPDSISIVELATIADMLGLEGLKEAIMFTLKAKYCHHFHRPCVVCTAGVLECFPLSSVYGLDDLYRKCLRWITKYFSRVWPTKAFATLPKELLDKCYQQHIVNLTTDNIVDTVYGCGIIVASLQNSRWAEIVARMCRRLVNAAAHFAAPRLAAVLRAVAPQAPEAPHPAKQALDDCLAAAIEWAPPDEACRAYAFLSALVKEIRCQHYSKPDLITNGNPNKVSSHNNLLYTHASSWRLQCEGALVRAAPRVVGTQAFKDLPADLRKRLRELGCIMYGAQAIPITSSPLPDRKRRSTYHSKAPTNVTNNTSVTRSLDIDHVRASFVPYSPKPGAPIGSVDILKSNNDLRDKKSNRLNPPKIRTTKAQEERAKFNLSKNNQSQDRSNNKAPAPSRLVSVENTKPRYLEPRVSKESDKKLPAPRKLVPKMISSSESSRNSSPIQARNLRTSRVKSRQACEVKAQAMSQDSLATSSRPRTAEPSTDSLSESHNSNKYATYTKAKHTTKGSIESIKSSKCLTVSQAVPQSTVSNRLKTKIPVYLNQGIKYHSADDKRNGESQKRVPQSMKTVTATCGPSNAVCRNKITERKVPGSLMNATKSSSAKVVPKIVKESHSNKSTSKQPKRGAGHSNRLEEYEQPPDIPVMERSGTFLKDEPTFGDITTIIDIDQ